MVLCSAAVSNWDLGMRNSCLRGCNWNWYWYWSRVMGFVEGWLDQRDLDEAGEEGACLNAVSWTIQGKRLRNP